MQSGEFADEWIAEKRSGSLNYRNLVEEARESQVETAGRAFRNILETGTGLKKIGRNECKSGKQS